MNGSQESHVRLRPMTEADLERVLGWRNHPDVRQYMYSQDLIGLEEHAHWFRTALEDAGRTLLVLEIDGMPCGQVNFRLAAPQEALWGFYLAPGAPRGSGTLLGNTATDHAFEVLGLEKVWGEVLPENLSSQRFHLRHGFVLEAILAEKAVNQRTIPHIHRYLLTKSAWQTRKGNAS